MFRESVGIPDSGDLRGGALPAGLHVSELDDRLGFPSALGRAFFKPVDPDAVDPDVVGVEAVLAEAAASQFRMASDSADSVRKAVSRCDLEHLRAGLQVSFRTNMILAAVRKELGVEDVNMFVSFIQSAIERYFEDLEEEEGARVSPLDRDQSIEAISNALECLVEADKMSRQVRATIDDFIDAIRPS